MNRHPLTEAWFVLPGDCFQSKKAVHFFDLLAEKSEKSEKIILCWEYEAWYRPQGFKKPR